MPQTHFNWCIDTSNYINDKNSDKMPLKDFIRVVIPKLNEYRKYEWETLKTRPPKHCHNCSDLQSKKSEEAKKILHRVKNINDNLDGGYIELSDIFQIPIDQTTRCFGYVLRGIFHIIFIDTKHKVYKE